MSIHYNVPGQKRKELAKEIATWLGCLFIFTLFANDISLDYWLSLDNRCYRWIIAFRYYRVFFNIFMEHNTSVILTFA